MIHRRNLPRIVVSGWVEVLAVAEHRDVGFEEG
jgi:hypothetical protein